MAKPAFEGGALADQTDIDLDQGFRKLALDRRRGLLPYDGGLGFARAETTAMLPDAKHAIVGSRRNCP